MANFEESINKINEIIEIIRYENIINKNIDERLTQIQLIIDDMS